MVVMVVILIQNSSSCVHKIYTAFYVYHTSIKSFKIFPDLPLQLVSGQLHSVYVYFRGSFIHSPNTHGKPTNAVGE